MNWETKRIKDIFSFSKGLSITKEDLVEKGVPVISYGQIHSKQNKGVKIDDSLIRFVGEEYLESGEKSLTNKHDFLFADTSEDFEGCGNNVYVDRDMTLFAGYHTIILRNKKPQDCRYFAYQFNSDDWRTQIRKNVCGIKVYSITQKSLSNISLLVPPESMQKKISDFLDMKTQGIDARIEILEKKKERYTILRQAIINEALNAEGKNWEARRVKDVIQLKARIGWKGLRSDEFQTKSFAYLVTGQDFSSSEIQWKDCYQIDKERYDEDPYIQLKNGDVLVTKDGTIGKVAMVNNLDKPACLNSGVFVLHQKKPVFTQKFLFWELQSNIFSDFIAQNSDGATIQHLYQNVFDFLNLYIPTIEDQEKIATYLDVKTYTIDSIVENITKEIDSLKIYRRTLINEAVTGKLNIE